MRYNNVTYKNFLKKIEDDLNTEDIVIMSNFCNEIEYLRQYLSKAHGSQVKDKELDIFHKLDQFFLKGEKLEKVIKKDMVIRKTKRLFRKIMKEVLYQSDLIKYSTLKTKGYSGDYKIIEAIYENNPVSRSELGVILDKYLLNNFYAEAIRQRKNKMRDFLKDFISLNSGRKIRILNLACGSCREIREMFKNNFEMNAEVEFNLIDKDDESIKFSKDNLSQYKKYCSFNFICSDVITYLKNNLSSADNFASRFDLVYSIGLADYLPNVLLELLVYYSVENLNGGGVFLFAHKNTKLYTFPISDWATDWYFIPRNDKDVFEIIRRRIDFKRTNIKLLNSRRDSIMFFLLSPRNTK